MVTEGRDGELGLEGERWEKGSRDDKIVVGSEIDKWIPGLIPLAYIFASF